LADRRDISFDKTDDYVANTGFDVSYGWNNIDYRLAGESRGLCQSIGAFVWRRDDDVRVFYRYRPGYMSAVQTWQDNIRDRRWRIDYADQAQRRLSRGRDVCCTADELDNAIAGPVDQADACGRTCTC